MTSHFFLHYALGKVQECAQYDTHGELKKLTKLGWGGKQIPHRERKKKKVFIFIKGTLITLT